MPTAREAREAAAAALAKNPDLARRLADQQAQRMRFAQQQAEESRELLNDLAAVGLPVRSVWDLADYRDDHPAAVTVLLKHLGVRYPGRIREGIGRALGGPSARPHFAFLIDQFIQTDDEHLRRGLSVAIARLALQKDFPQVEALIRNRSYGKERSFLVAYVRRCRLAEAERLLSELLDDPDIGSLAKTSLEKRLRRKRKAGR